MVVAKKHRDILDQQPRKIHDIRFKAECVKFENVTSKDRAALRLNVLAKKQREILDQRP